MPAISPVFRDAMDEVTLAGARQKLGFPVGNIFYVDSVTGSSSNGGVSYDAPKATIAQALALCTASKGDIIVCLSTHAETITAAAGIDVNVAGVTLISLGNGTNRATIGIGTATSATFRVSALNVTIRNFRFRAVTAQLLVTMIDLTAGSTTMEDCWFQGASTSTFLVQSFIKLTTTKDDFTFTRCHFYQGTDPAAANGAADTGVFYMVDSENVFIDDCLAFGNFETAIVHNKTTKAQNLWIRNPRFYCALSDCVPYILVAAASGGAIDGGNVIPAAADATESGLVGTVGDNFGVFGGSRFLNDSLAGGSGGIIPATAS